MNDEKVAGFWNLSPFFSSIWIMKIQHLFIILFFFFLTACDKEPTPIIPSLDETPYELTLPEGFPDLTIPDNNQLTQARVRLGKKLFYDPILSRDTSISCNSCHLQAHAFSDNKAISPGVEGRLGFRNAPTLANVAYLDVMNKDGGVTKFGIQALTPIEDENEMDLSILKAAARLNEIPEYVELSHQAYGKAPDAFVISRALASFQRTMISGNSPYDQFYIQGKMDVLTAQEQRGKTLFFSERTQCSTCHEGFDFTNGAFENNGLYLEYADQGRKRVTAQEEDRAKFRVPTLRNVELTAPYMHDGSVESLEDVVAHYNAGGEAHVNKSELIRPLNLTAAEQADLVAFLKTLTDESFINNPEFLAE